MESFSSHHWEQSSRRKPVLAASWPAASALGRRSDAGPGNSLGAVGGYDDQATVEVPVQVLIEAFGWR